MLPAVATKPRMSKDSGAASIIMMAAASSCPGSVVTMTLVGIKIFSISSGEESLRITAPHTILDAARRGSLIGNDRPLCATADTQQTWVLSHRHGYISAGHRGEPGRIPAFAGSAFYSPPHRQSGATVCSALGEVSLRWAVVLLLSG